LSDQKNETQNKSPAIRHPAGGFAWTRNELKLAIGDRSDSNSFESRPRFAA
jgi:hypothetical protein